MKRRNIIKFLSLASKLASKLSSIKNLIFQALIDLEITLEEVITIVKKNKTSYEKMRENIRVL